MKDESLTASRIYAQLAKNGLKGKKVGILRPKGQSTQLAAAIERHGGFPIFAPAIEIVLDYEAGEMQRVFRDLSNSSIDYLIFTSSNGVRSFYKIAAIQGWEPFFGSKLKIIAVGPRTSEALTRNGIRSVIVPNRYSSMGILDLLTNEGIQGKRITLLRGSRSGDTLPSGLQALGAKVHSVFLYRTNLAGSRELDDFIELITMGQVDIVLFTSPSTVRSLLSSASRLGFDSSILEKVIVSAIGPVTGNYLRRRGIQVMVESYTFEIAGLIKSISKYLDDKS